MYVEESPPAAVAPVAKSPWSGGGGRWMIWPMRVILWVAILVIGYRGVMAIVLNESPANPNTPAPSASSSSSAFPVTRGEAFALEFGQVYLNFSPATSTKRARQLAEFIPASVHALDPQFGWNGAGSQQLQSEQVVGIGVRSAQTAVVTLLAMVNGQLIELGVPLYVSGDGIVVSGEPALLAAPPAAVPPSARQASSDPAAQSALASMLPAFFTAYASGDQATLSRYLAPGVSLNGLGGAVRFGSIASITVPRGGATRDITVTVDWMLPGQVSADTTELATTYDMSVIDQQTGKWYVKEIRASTQPMGTP